jgi:hypothetical protein
VAAIKGRNWDYKKIKDSFMIEVRNANSDYGLHCRWQTDRERHLLKCCVKVFVTHVRALIYNYMKQEQNSQYYNTSF